MADTIRPGLARQALRSGRSVTDDAKAWLSIGGQIMIDPDNRLISAISADRIFSLELTDAQAEERMAISRAYNVAEAGNRAIVASLVREHGEPTANGFIVWQEA